MTDSRKQPPLAFPEGGVDAQLQALEARPEVAELKRSLQTLPDIEPDPALWAGIQGRARRAGRDTSGSRQSVLRPFAMAAGLLLAVTAGMLSVNVLRDADFARTLPPDHPAPLAGGFAALAALKQPGGSPQTRATERRGRRQE